MIESMLIAGFLGLPAAMLTAMLLKRRCLARYFYKASLIFVATCVLAFGPGKFVSAFGGHKGQTVHMDTDAKDKAKTTKDKVKAASLIEQAPIVIDINRGGITSSAANRLRRLSGGFSNGPSASLVGPNYVVAFQEIICKK